VELRSRRDEDSGELEPGKERRGPRLSVAEKLGAMPAEPGGWRFSRRRASASGIAVDLQRPIAEEMRCGIEQKAGVGR
jgi:hypothetical protein